MSLLLKTAKRKRIHFLELVLRCMSAKRVDIRLESPLSPGQLVSRSGDKMKVGK